MNDCDTCNKIVEYLRDKPAHMPISTTAENDGRVYLVDLQKLHEWHTQSGGVHAGYMDSWTRQVFNVDGTPATVGDNRARLQGRLTGRVMGVSGVMGTTT